MEKTIKYLLERTENCKKASDKLGEKSATFAEFLMEKMEELGTSILTTEDGYSVRSEKMNTSVGSYHYLTPETPCRGCNIDLTSSVISTGGYYVYGDFNCWIDYPELDIVLEFIGKTMPLLKVLDKLIHKIEEITK